MSVTLKLHDPVCAGNGAIDDVTHLLDSSWRRSIRRIGGYWLGTCELHAGPEVRRGMLDEWFTYGLMREIRETAGGEETWRGALVKAEYNSQGEMYVRDATTMTNTIRSIYTRLGDNLLTNGSAESGAWTVYNGATVTQDATWSSHGTYSCKIVLADAGVRGAWVQSAITIVAGVQYEFRAAMKIVSGGWRIDARRSDNNQLLAGFNSNLQIGDVSASFTIPEANTYSGDIYILAVHVHTSGAGGTCYIDGCVFQTAPVKAETGWYTDLDSIAVYGRKEEVLLRGGKSNADAQAECQSELLDRAWANTPPTGGSQTWSGKVPDDTLRLTFAGYWATLNWLFTTLHGTRVSSDWISALAALQSTYLAIGRIEVNATDYFVDDRGPLKCGDLMRDIAISGETGGAKYAVGVYAGRQLIYEKVPQTLSYYRRGGRLYYPAGGEVEAWRARPGWILRQDMPIGPGSLTANAQHDPRWAYVEEMEMLPPGADGRREIAFKYN
jgi:hypothetical protein